MAQRINRYLRVGLQPGMFGNEYTVVLQIHGRKLFSTIAKDHVRVDREPAGSVDGEGLIGVSVVESVGDDAVVDLPSPAFTSEPRLRVPVTSLVE